jgi:hypothetical protein
MLNESQPRAGSVQKLTRSRRRDCGNKHAPRPNFGASDWSA